MGTGMWCWTDGIVGELRLWQPWYGMATRYLRRGRSAGEKGVVLYQQEGQITIGSIMSSSTSTSTSTISRKETDDPA